MSLDLELALEPVLAAGDEWQAWRALRLTGEAPSELPRLTGSGALEGPGGRLSPGATGEELTHLTVLRLEASARAQKAADWLEAARTPAGAWLDAPSDVPGVVEEAAAGRVWATAAAACGLAAFGRDPGERAVTLLRSEANSEGRVTGGSYPTFAAAGLFWLVDGPRSEMAEWALRWAREWEEDWWGPWELVTALTFWGAAGVPVENSSVERFLDRLRLAAGDRGWPEEPELTLRAVEVLSFFES